MFSKTTIAVCTLLSVSLFLGACGGGGGGGGGSTTPTIPTLTVTLSSTSGSASGDESGAAPNLTTNATISGTSSSAIVADLQYDRNVFTSVTATPGITASSYVVTAQPASNLAFGDYNGSITFRLCQETACTNVYPGSTVAYTYSLSIGLNEWTTYQRNNAHTAYVHTTLDISKFAKAWEWNPPIVAAISSAVSTKGVVYFTTQEPSNITVARPSAVFALNETDGTQKWRYDLAAPTTVGHPTLANGHLYVATVSTTQVGTLSAINTTSGTLAKTFGFDTQWIQGDYPTVSNDNIFFSGGTFGTVLYSYSQASGATRWTHNTVNTMNGTAVSATDGTYVYYYNGKTLNAVRASDGVLVKSLLDPYAIWEGYDYDSGVILGGAGNAIAYSGSTSFPGQYLNYEHYSQRPLVNYNLTTNTDTWKAANAYFTNPALAKGVIYVARNNPSSLDAISEANGSVLWSWSPPAGENFHRNTIVTDNLVFISTNKAVYAIDISDHTTKWSYPMPGTLTLSSGFVLYISADLIENIPGTSPAIDPARSRGKLVAIKLR